MQQVTFGLNFPLVLAYNMAFVSAAESTSTYVTRSKPAAEFVV